mmetsp:Transcript_26218/g.57446  ORF Transcript_26218/g.57446 Transcript_26218/m.57446 type:complete len:233 (+) Transcript_26218:894-1592(+)
MVRRLGSTHALLSGRGAQADLSRVPWQTVDRIHAKSAIVVAIRGGRRLMAKFYPFYVGVCTLWLRNRTRRHELPCSVDLHALLHVLSLHERILLPARRRVWRPQLPQMGDVLRVLLAGTHFVVRCPEGSRSEERTLPVILWPPNERRVPYWAVRLNIPESVWLRGDAKIFRSDRIISLKGCGRLDKDSTISMRLVAVAERSTSSNAFLIWNCDVLMHRDEACISRDTVAYSV